MDRELTSILRYRLAASRREQELPVSGQGPSASARGAFRVDFERAIATLPAPVQETAFALFWCSTLDAADELRCSRQMIHNRKRQIRAALVSAGVGPRYFTAGGAM
jgi:DNA-directed RNA polymerase specialized sigma24 family protein